MTDRLETTMTTKTTTTKTNTKTKENTMTNDAIIANINEQNKRIADYLLDLMERDGLHWVKDWSAPMVGHCNPVTGTVYSGRNAFITAAMAEMMGFKDTRWMTRKQIEKHGYVLDEEDELTPVYIEKWKPTVGKKKVEVKNADGTTTEEWRSFHYMKLVGGYVIYNAEQIFGIPEPEEQPETAALADNLTAIADRFIKTSRCKVHEKSSKEAFYSPAKDEITIPKRTQFDSTEAFLRTLLHEMGHSTAKPLYRETKCKRWGDSAYAFEELVAELTSAFTAASVGVDITDAEYKGDYAEQHAAYLQSWREGCDNPETAMFSAAALATSASLYLYQDYMGIDREALKAERKAKRDAYKASKVA